MIISIVTSSSIGTYAHVHYYDKFHDRCRATGFKCYPIVWTKRYRAKVEDAVKTADFELAAIHIAEEQTVKVTSFKAYTI